LLGAIAVLIVVGAGAVGALAYDRSSTIVDELWTRLANSMADATTERALRYFVGAAPWVELTRLEADAGRLELGPFDESKRPDSLLSYLGAAIRANESFTWASFASDDGSYVSARRTTDGEITGVWRSVTATGTAMRELVSSGDTWRVSTKVAGDYDPRRRQWFRIAADEGGWVQPFVFATVRQAGFMFVRKQPSVQGRPGGVWAVEYEGSAMSDFLDRLKVGPRGRVYVVTGDGLVVGHPDGATVTGAGEELEVARAMGHEDEMLAEAWRSVVSDPTHRDGAFTAGEYLVMARPFPEHGGVDWTVLVVTPEAEMFAAVRAQAWQTLGIAAVAALLALLAGTVFSNRISGALRSIATDLERIGRFELDGETQGGQSFVREVNDMHETAQRMKASLRSFGKYVPREVVRELFLTGHEAEIGGEKAELTILFSDIAGFTSVAEKMDPSDLTAVLAEYLDGCSQAINQHGATVDKYIGDAIMAFWGAPRANPEHALAACRGALAMQVKLRELQASWTARGLPELATRIGLNTGEVVVGNFGASDRLNYTVMGDPANLASRLEALNKAYGTSIIVGETTAEAVGDHMVLRPLEWVAVKGKTQAILLHELLGEAGDVDDATLAKIERYGAALETYRERRFEGAAKQFEAIADDPPSALLATRARAFAATPPPDDWDGRHVMTTK